MEIDESGHHPATRGQGNDLGGLFMVAYAIWFARHRV
jgi:hypothetical protein